MWCLIFHKNCCELGVKVIEGSGILPQPHQIKQLETGAFVKKIPHPPKAVRYVDENERAAYKSRNNCDWYQRSYRFTTDGSFAIEVNIRVNRPLAQDEALPDPLQPKLHRKRHKQQSHSERLAFFLMFLSWPEGSNSELTVPNSGLQLR